MKLNVEDKKDRRVLSEGRDRQMGFAFCKKNGEVYETVHPISPCKDYLSDVIWTENTGKSISACGLNYKKIGIYDGDLAYMVIKICPLMSGKPYDNFEVDRKRLRDNYGRIVEVVNNVEDELGLQMRSEIFQTNDDDMFLLKLPRFWCQYAYLTSLYSLLVRMAQWYDGQKTPAEFLDKFSSGMDIYLWNEAKPRLRYLIKCGMGNVPKQNADSHPHSSGIIGCLELKQIA